MDLKDGHIREAAKRTLVGCLLKEFLADRCRYCFSWLHGWRLLRVEPVVLPLSVRVAVEGLLVEVQAAEIGVLPRHPHRMRRRPVA